MSVVNAKLVISALLSQKHLANPVVILEQEFLYFPRPLLGCIVVLLQGKYSGLRRPSLALFRNAYPKEEYVHCNLTIKNVDNICVQVYGRGSDVAS